MHFQDPSQYNVEHIACTHHTIESRMGIICGTRKCFDRVSRSNERTGSPKRDFIQLLDHVNILDSNIWKFGSL